MTVIVSSALLTQLMRESTIGACHEICGVLRGRGEEIKRADRARNVSPTPATAFEIDPATLIGAHRAARRANALDVLGYYHSHPTGDILPSATDAEGAAPDGAIWLIFNHLRARMWRAVENGSVHGRFDPVRFRLRVGAKLSPALEEVKHRDYGKTFEVRFEGRAGDPSVFGSTPAS